MFLKIIDNIWIYSQVYNIKAVSFYQSQLEKFQ